MFETTRLWFSLICSFLTTITFTQCTEYFISSACSYHDTVDLTNATRYNDGFYEYKNIFIPEDLVSSYDYHIQYQNERIETASHLRGCICSLQACVRWCCDDNEVFNGEICTKSKSHINVAATEQLKLFHHQMNWKPCRSLYHLDANKFQYDAWELYDNGSLIITNGMKMFTKEEFCLTILRKNNDTMIIPFLCDESEDDEELEVERNILYAFSMMCSLPFIVVTILIYVCVPELNNLHGKALCCYLTGLLMGYSIMSFFMIREPDVGEAFCIGLTYVAYFSFMSSFFWLSVISFDIYSSFRGVARNHSTQHATKKFLYYCVYCLGLAGLFVLFTFLAQNSDLMPYKYKPKIGNDYNCWFDVDENFSATIYFYGPLIIIILFNILMFSLTSWKIYLVQRETHRIIGVGDESQRNLNHDKTRFGLFLRLFLVMGVTWTAEIASYFLGKTYDHLFYVTDFLNMIQGVLIFIFFVMKKRVKRLLVKRYNSWKNGNSYQPTNSNRTSYRTTLTSTKMTTDDQHNSMALDDDNVEIPMKDLINK